MSLIASVILVSHLILHLRIGYALRVPRAALALSATRLRSPAQFLEFEGESSTQYSSFTKLQETKYNSDPESVKDSSDSQEEWTALVLRTVLVLLGTVLDCRPSVGAVA